MHPVDENGTIAGGRCPAAKLPLDSLYRARAELGAERWVALDARRGGVVEIIHAA